MAKKIKNKGQITIFIIVAIILVAIALFFIFYSKIKPASINPLNVQDYIDSCMKTSGQEAINLAEERGGYLNPGNYILSKINSCFDSLKIDLEKRNYRAIMQEGNFSVELSPGKVILEDNRKMTITKNEQTLNYGNFQAVIPSRLYEFADIAQEISNQEAKFCNFEYLGYMILYNSWIIDKDELNGQNKIYTIKDKKESKINIGKILITFLKVWIERSKLGIVSAEEQTQPYNYEVFGGFNWQGQAGLQTVCCPRLKNNATCQEILSANTQDCATDVIPSKCENTVQCKLGCCYDSQEGLCSANTPKDSCKTVWKDDKACNIPECKLGCCVLGSQTSFVSKSRCDKLSGFLGLQPDFKAAVNTEIGCIALSNSQEEGACVYKLGQDKACRFTTKSECLKLTKSGEFFPGYLCSNPAINVSCTKQAKTGCVAGKDEVYWFDSCGNRENIYDANKDKSWNSGLILRKQESCNSGNGNADNVNCGNCDYFSGSICGKSTSTKPVYGNFICENLNCKDAPDNVGVKDRKNW